MAAEARAFRVNIGRPYQSRASPCREVGTDTRIGRTGGESAEVGSWNSNQSADAIMGAQCALQEHSISI